MHQQAAGTVRTARPQGRPRDEAKAAAIVEAARELFLEHGYDAVTIEGVAQRARVSKVTVYARHANKERLFQAVVAREREKASDGILAAVPADADLRTALGAFGRAYLRCTRTPEILAMERLMISQAQRQPALARLYHEAGPLRMRANLVGVVRARAVASAEAVDRLARDLLVLLNGPRNLSLRLGEAGAAAEYPDPDAYAERCADMALAGFRT